MSANLIDLEAKRHCNAVNLRTGQPDINISTGDTRKSMWINGVVSFSSCIPLLFRDG